MNDESVDYLFFGAHPDDVELGCGATIAKLVKSGSSAGIIDLTSGEMGTRGTPAERKREAAASARILGAAFREQLNFGDGALRTGREEELQVVEIIRRHRPRVVFVMYPDDRHPDHTRSGRIVTEASFYSGLRKLETGLAPHRPQAVIYYIQNYMFPPSFVVDTTATWKTKMRAIAAFKSQFYVEGVSKAKSKEPETFISSKKFVDLIEARGRHFGGLIGSAYGEGFVTKQPPMLDDIAAAYGNREP